MLLRNAREEKNNEANSRENALSEFQTGQQEVTRMVAIALSSLAAELPSRYHIHRYYDGGIDFSPRNHHVIVYRSDFLSLLGAPINAPVGSIEGRFEGGGETVLVALPPENWTV